MTYLIYDLAIVALLALALWRGYRRGFVLTLCGFLAIFVALIGATVLSNALTEPVSRSIRPIVEQHIQQSLEQRTDGQSEGASSADGQEDGEEGSDSLTLSSVLEALQDSALYKGFADAIRASVDKELMAVSSNIVRSVADYVAKQLAHMVLFFTSFVVILVLWFFVSHALDLAFRLPVLSTLNRWSGAALGLFRGGLLIFIACCLLKDSFLPQDAVQNSFLLHFFCTVNPVSLFF